MIIKRIVLTNFQSHKDTAIEFDPYFNCICGPSNVGKTAIVNALLFVFFNEWNNDFLRVAPDSDGKCIIKVEFDDNTAVIRTKSKYINKLEFLEGDTVIQSYSNFGTEYPVEVLRKFRGLIEDISICIALQDNNAFLINEPPSIKGKLLSHLSGVNILDDVTNSVLAELRSVDEQIQIKTAEVERLKIEMSKYDSLEKAEEIYKKYVALCKKYELWMQQYLETKRLNEELKRVNNEIQKYVVECAKYNVDFSYAFEEAEKSLSAVSLVENLSNLSKEIVIVEEQYEGVQKSLIDVIKTIGDLLMELKVCPMCGSEFSERSIDYIFTQEHLHA